MSNDQPPPGQPPEDDPFLKKPPESQPPSQEPPPGSPYGSPYGGAGGPGGPGEQPPSQPPPYDPNAYGGGAYGGADPLAGMPPLADFGKRLLARIIDGLIVLVPLFLISLLFGGVDVASGGDDGWDDITDQMNTGGQWISSLISLIAYVGYDTLMIKKNGQTVGKRVMKLRVAMLNDGSVPDMSSSLMRAAVLWIPALVCCFCIWWIVIIITMLTDKPYKQGLHDKAGKTVVVSAA